MMELIADDLVFLVSSVSYSFASALDDTYASRIPNAKRQLLIT